VTRVGLEDRADLDGEPGLLRDLAPERVRQRLLAVDEATEEAPLRRAEGMTREDDAAVGGDADAVDTDEEPRVGAVEDASLPSDRYGVIDLG
jgi:hypothetical protein